MIALRQFRGWGAGGSLLALCAVLAASGKELNSASEDILVPEG